MKINTVVIGAGPGGYVAAIKLAQLGIETAIVEKNKIGGVCLNEGCIPSKAIIHVAKSYYASQFEYRRLGIKIPEVQLDFPTMISWKDRVIKRLIKGVENLLNGNKIKIIQGTASFISANKLIIHKEGQEDISLEFDHCIIATGSNPINIPQFNPDNQYVLNSSQALSMTQLPTSIAIIGGGYIGLELGMAFAKFGTKVTIVEFLDQVLATFDKDVVQLIHSKLKKLKVTVQTSSKAIAYETDDKQVKLSLETTDGTKTIDTEKIVITVGRKPNTDDLNLDQLGIKLNSQGFIQVNQKMQTDISHIFAIGDVASQPMLAHKASKEGEVAALNIAGHETLMQPGQIPSIVFTDPEIAVSGLSENEALNIYSQDELNISQFPFAALGRAMTADNTQGFVKIISNKKTKQILGTTIVGPQASDLISEAALAIENGVNIDSVAETIHPHPTYGEILMEAAKGNLGQAIHILNN